jgi:hypothetical protein
MKILLPTLFAAGEPYRMAHDMSWYGALSAVPEKMRLLCCGFFYL